MSDSSPAGFVFKTLAQSGIKGTHICWQTKQVPDLPWFAYRLDKFIPTVADNHTWAGIYKFRCELFMRYFDQALVSRFCHLIDDAFGAYDYEEIWLTDDKCLMVTFTFSYIPKQKG